MPNRPAPATPTMRPAWCPVAAICLLAASSEVVPHADAHLLLEIVERLVLATLAVEVVAADAHRLARHAAPQPAGLGGEVAAEVDLFAQMAR